MSLLCYSPASADYIKSKSPPLNVVVVINLDESLIPQLLDYVFDPTTTEVIVKPPDQIKDLPNPGVSMYKVGPYY